ncbi:radical SAM protein [Patescibacteria group bacterium]|nr:radical SAM protein [Patescibacteria group bacterium]
MIMVKIADYKNGNVSVQIFSDGTKVRSYEGLPKPIFPESIDVKITNHCNLMCPYCHENSNRQGRHGDLETLSNALKDLPAGVELAIGGGNPLSHPMLQEFLGACKRKGWITNITINQEHLYKKYYFYKVNCFIEQNLINGIGVSIPIERTPSYKKALSLGNNVVFHIVAGIHDISILDEIIDAGGTKVLILGYKRFGRGEKYYNKKIEDNIKQWYMYLPKYIGKLLLAFDNLGIEQLNIRRLFTDEEWSKFYMGDDFAYTMYVDAVEQKYAKSSRDVERKNFNKCSLLDYFKEV